MLSPEKCFNALKQNGVAFFTGVPDSSLKNFTAFITDNCGKGEHIIAANEGTAIAMAIGNYLATGKLPFVYMQNSGLGNAINPLLSLADEMVYKIPMLIMIGWRGKPGVKDEPQHKKQGKVMTAMLESMEISYTIMDDDESLAIQQIGSAITSATEKSVPHVLIARPSLFDPYKLKNEPTLSAFLSREEALKIVVDHLDETDIVVSTTGKLSRELFEYRDELKQNHDKDFLTVGGMGHCSSIACGITLEEKTRRVFCLDGDGAVLMHTGALSNIGNLAPGNYFHIIFNNGAHESVGGQPTLGFDVDFPKIAEAFNYKEVKRVDTREEIVDTLENLKTGRGPFLMEIRVGINSRKDLGRPSIPPETNKENFMKKINKVEHEDK
jgi:phosphonopyruvate decarboxylase